MRAPFLGLVAAILLTLATACGSDNGESAAELPQGSEPVELEAADFVDEIDNPYWPMAVGSRWVYRETDQAGIIIPGEPEVGQAYRQEYYEGEAEDNGEILSLDATAKVPFGSFEGVLKTKDTNALEPGVLEHKYYAKDVGPVLAVNVSGGGREVLLEFEPG
jgi:hypothetical protein